VDGIAVGRGIRALRIRRRWTQDELGRRAGVSRGVVARLEQGGGDAVTLRKLGRVAAALGARVHVRLSWNGEGLDRLLDARHAATVDQVLEHLRRAGWTAAAEVSFNSFGERGAIDVLAFHGPSRTLLVVEVKSVIPDIQAMLATLDRKVRLAPQIARMRGWNATSVSTVLVVTDSRTSRRRVDAVRATFDAALPDRGWAIRRWLRSPNGLRPVRGVWFLSSDTHPVGMQRVRASSAAIHARPTARVPSTDRAADR
jgi:transcriptional regulator with XRE-family HTH domain